MTEEVDGPWGPISVKHLIYESPGEFIVFVDNEFDLDWQINDKYIADHLPQYLESLSATNAAMSVATMPCENLTDKDHLKFKCLLGEAVKMALFFDNERAIEMVDIAREFNTARNMELSRFWQLLYSLVTVIVLSLLGFFIWWARSWVHTMLGDAVAQKFFILMQAFIAGSVGAFLSIAYRMGSLGKEKSGANLVLHILETVTRLAAGGVSGIFGIVAMNSGLLLSNLASNCGDNWNVLLVSMAAGLSERFVPSIISKAGLPADTAPPAQPTAPAAPQPAQRAQPQQPAAPMPSQPVTSQPQGGKE